MKYLRQFLSFLFLVTNKSVGRKEFFRNTVFAGVLTLLLNASLIALFYYSKHTGSSTLFNTSLIGLLIINLLFPMYFSTKVCERINDFRGETKRLSAFFFAAALLFPYAGIYLYILLSRKDSKFQTKWSFRRHTLIALLAPILLFAPFRFSITSFDLNDRWWVVTPVVFYSTLYDIGNPTTRFLGEMFVDASQIIKLQKSCASEGNCFERFIARAKQKQLATLSSGLGVTIINAQEVGKYRKDNPDKLSNEVLEIESRLMFIERNSAVLELAKSKRDLVDLTLPFGIYLLSGTIEFPLLMIIDEADTAQLVSLVLESLKRLHSEADALLGSGAEHDQFRSRLSQTMEKIVELESHYSYYSSFMENFMFDVMGSNRGKRITDSMKII